MINNKINPFEEIDIDFEDGEILLPVTEKSVPGVKPYYYVSNKGNVYSDSTGTLKRMIPRDAKTGLNERGAYQEVNLAAINENGDSIAKNTKIHRLVAIEFLGHKMTEENNTVDHLDCNKRNNNVENLEWVSLDENIKRAFKNGLHDMPLEKDKILLNAIIHELKRGLLSHREIAERYGVSLSQVNHIKYHNSYNYITEDERNFERKRDLTDDDLVEIFDRSHAGESFIDLANEFGISVHSVRHIYYPNGGRYEKRLANKGRILARVNKYSTDNELKEIYIKAQNGTTDEELSNEYGYSVNIIRRMRNGCGNYKNRLRAMGIEVKVYEPMSDEKLLEIYNLAKEGVKDAEIAKRYGIHPKSVNELRIGGKRYREFLDKYNLPEIRYVERTNTKSNMFTEKEAIDIYNELKNTGISAKKLAKIKGCDKSVIANIKYCRRSYDYLRYKYNLKPLD